MRQLKHHEKKLIKKVDLFNWKSDRTIREAEVADDNQNALNGVPRAYTNSTPFFILQR